MRNKISTIVPVYNGGRFIKKTLDSICYQLGNFDTEVIIIDSESSDDTEYIVKEYYKEVDNLPNVKMIYVREKDEGVMDAWSKGLKLASGKYVSFCNTSDYYLDMEWFKRSFMVFDSHNWVNAVFGLNLILDESDKYLGVGGKRVIPILGQKQNPSVSATAFFADHITWNECSAILNKSALESVLPFDTVNPGGTLKAQREFMNNGYLCYFINIMAAMTLRHTDSKTANQGSDSDKEMWAEHRSKLQEFGEEALESGFKYRDCFGNVLGTINFKEKQTGDKN